MSTTTVTRKNWTDTCLLYYSGEHVWYETCMFLGAATAILSGTAFISESPGLLFLMRNAPVEAFGLHLRNLLDFFRPEREPRDTDVVAADYFDNNRLPHDFPELSPLAKSAREKANKELAHLTTQRKKALDPEKKWQVRELTAEMIELIKHFIHSASSSKLNSDYIAQVEHLLNIHALPATAGERK